MKMEQTECSETSAYKIHTPGNYPKENIQQKYITYKIKKKAYKTYNQKNTKERKQILYLT